MKLSEQLFITSPTKPSLSLITILDTIVSYVKATRLEEEDNHNIDWHHKHQTSVILTNDTQRKDDMNVALFFNKLILLYEYTPKEGEDSFMYTGDKKEIYFYNPTSLDKQFLKLTITQIKKQEKIPHYSIDMSSANSFSELKNALFSDRSNLLQSRFYFSELENKKINNQNFNQISIAFEKYQLDKALTYTEISTKETKTTKKLKI